LYFLLLRATLMSFSGFASVPLVREDLVIQRGVLTDVELNNAIAVSQVSPGPLGAYIVVVGYFVGGVPGAIAGALALATPALLAIPIAWLVRQGGAARIRGACDGIVIVSCVLMLSAAIGLAPEAAPTPPLVVISIAGFVVLTTTRLPPIAVIVAGACIASLM
jgi:chromate transporter